MIRKILTYTLLSAAATLSAAAAPQVYIEDDDFADEEEEVLPEELADVIAADNDSTRPACFPVALPSSLFLPAVYQPYEQGADDVDLMARPSDVNYSPTYRLDRQVWMYNATAHMRQRLAMQRPDLVRYNHATLPEVPKQYEMLVDPSTARVIVKEVKPQTSQINMAQVELDRQRWINKLNFALQFSQAYVSPNWYQGGNSALNMILDINYTTKLNTKFYPKLLFENTFQWRTALTSSPDDEYRNYNLTENLFQVNSKFGYKAGSHWYYTINGMLKTPVFHGYKSGTLTRTASLFSPGELNVGLGMTYTLTKSKFNLNATIAPISYNLKTCIDRQIDETSFGIEEGRKSVSAYGSTIDMTWNWTICYNVAWTSRVFAFTDYSYLQVDWQNTIKFTINRFLTANVNIDARYDTSSPRRDDTKWHKVQLREILSLGFSYAISH
jgi:hypothetical protein